jgi:glycosyltransferase
MLSVITALLDMDESIYETFISLRTQLDSEFEWVIKNNGSGEVDNLPAALRLSGIKLINRPDSSLYEGLNQALNLVSGEYFMVVGAGDKFLSSGIQDVLTAIKINEARYQFDSICFPVRVEGVAHVIQPEPARMKEGMYCPHPGFVAKTPNAAYMGGFDRRYRLASDYDFVIRYLKRWPKTLISDSPILEVKRGGLTDNNITESSLEAALIRGRHFGFN